MIKGFFKETAKKRKKKLAAQNKEQPTGKEVLAYKDGRPYFKEIKRKPLAEKFFQYRSIRFFYNYIFRHVLALVPRLQYSEYKTPQTGEKWVVIWFSWFGHTFWDKRYLLDPKDRHF